MRISRSFLAVILALCSSTLFAAPGVFRAQGTMNQPRRGVTLTLLQNGRVLAAGGSHLAGTPNDPTSAEIFEPTTRTWRSLAAHMSVGREGHSGTLLRDGRVLLAGGTGVSTAELFDPITEQFTPTTGSMNAVRGVRHVSTLLPDGRVLLVGGDTSGPTAELYDPSTGLFTSTSNSMASSHTASTLLPNGKVLVTGGVGADAAEIFDPATNSFAATTGPMVHPRFVHTSTLLANGLVLIAGGQASSTFFREAELFNPATGTFTATGMMVEDRERFTAALLPNGNVLLAQGDAGWTGVGSNWRYSRAEVYDVGTGTFSLTAGDPIGVAEDPQSVVLPEGLVLITGGYRAASTNASAISATQVFDYRGGTFTATDDLSLARAEATATMLGNNKVLVAGGRTSVPQSSAEIYDPAAGTFSDTASTMTVSRYGHTATHLPNGKVLIAGGASAIGSSFLASAELFDPSTGTFTAVPVNMSAARYRHTATLLADGRVLIAGGFNSSGYVGNGQIYNPTSNSFGASFSMVSPRAFHTATLLGSGKVLLTGGTNATGVLSTAEVFTPWESIFSASTGPLKQARQLHTATLLRTGDVLLAGGETIPGVGVATAEIFRIATSSFEFTAGSLPVGRAQHTATMLPSGEVLLTGGANGSTVHTSADLYDPYARNFRATTGVMTVARSHHVATLLPLGTVLVAGGPSFKADLFDLGLGINAARRPSITGLNGPVVQPDKLVATGGRFQGDSEAHGGVESASNYPVVELQRFETDNQYFLPFDGTTQWSSTFFRSMPLTNFPVGYYRVTVHAHGLPSVSQVITIDPQASLLTTSTTLTSSKNPSAYLESVTFTATVTTTTGQPSGTVTFFDGVNALGTQPLVAGVATLTTFALTQGVHDITATYNGDASFAASTSAVLQQRVIAAAHSDINGDNYSDIFWRNYATGQNAIWLMSNTNYIGGVNLPSVSDLNWRIEGTGDFNGDARPDLTWRNYATGQNACWILGADGSVPAVLNFPSVQPGLGWQIAGTGDFNSDGKMDIVWRNYLTGGGGANAVWLMNGASYITGLSLPAEPDNNWRIGAVADMNGDSRPDLVWRNYSTGQNRIWLIVDGAHTGTIVLSTEANTNWQIAGAAPMTYGNLSQADSKPADILWRNYSTGQNAVWFRQNPGVHTVWTATTLPTVSDTNWQLAGPR